MMRFVLIAVVLLLGVLGCSSHPPTAADPVTAGLALTLDMSQAPEAVVEVRAYLSRPGHETRSLVLEKSGTSASGQFAAVESGTWHLQVDALDAAEAVLYTGETDVDVGAGVTRVDLVLSPVNGGGIVVINVRWVEGTAGNALALDGIDDYADVPQPGALQSISDAITMEAWFYLDGSGNANTVFCMGDKTFGLNHVKNDGLTSGAPSGSDLPGILLGDLIIDPGNAMSFWGRIVLVNAISTETWTHMAVTYGDGTLRAYLDGDLVYSTRATGSIDASGKDFRIGARVSSYLEPLGGGIDEVRIWNVVRTPEEIQAALYTPLTGSEPGLVGYWRFDEAPGSPVASDATGNGNAATLRNGVLLVPSTAF